MRETDRQADRKSSNKSYYLITLFSFMFNMNVEVKFVINDDTQVLPMRTFSDGIVIE